MMKYKEKYMFNLLEPAARKILYSDAGLLKILNEVLEDLEG